MSKITKILLYIVSGILGAIIGFYGISYFTLPKSTYFSRENYVLPQRTIAVDDADISIHFLELGNIFTGDCTYIKTPEADILIDCGSKSNSIPTVANYLNKYVTDGTLEYVIVTHSHQDHYAGFATNENTDSIFDLFECEVIIDFAQTNQKSTAKTYANYIRERDDEIAQGAKHFTALDCIQGNVVNGVTAQRIFSIGENLTMEILDSYYYEHKSSNENNHSVCTLFTQTLANSTKSYLFTGDLESDGEAHLLERNNLPQKVELLKAGHHGSYTASSAEFLWQVQPKNVAVCCCAGSSEYTTTKANQFPSQEFVNRVAPYTSNVYVTTLCLDYANKQFTSFNGNIVVLSKGTETTVNCTNNNTKLKDTDWFKQNRTCPPEWK